MTTYEISYEHLKNQICSYEYSEDFVYSEDKYVFTKNSERQVKWAFNITDKLARIWGGVLTVTYDEGKKIFDYIIKIRTDKISFYNSKSKEIFNELITIADKVYIRVCEQFPDKIELVVIQCNADDIYSVKYYGYDDDDFY